MSNLTPEEAPISALLRVRVVDEAGDDVRAHLVERLKQLDSQESRAVPAARAGLVRR